MADPADSTARQTADLVYDSFYSGAIGGSVIALFFLAIDSVRGQPLFTPTLLGSALFGGAEATSMNGILLDRVAYYSVVHFAAFGLLGTLLSFLFHEAELHARNPVEILLLVVFVLEAASFIAAALWIPGVIERLGAFRIAVGNLLAGGAMVLFLLRSHRRSAEDGAAEQARLPS